MNMASNLTNYHSHSLYCDGHAPIKDFLDEAVRQGFTSYGVSPHAPLPWTTRWSMMELELPVFLYEMKRLKEEYKDRLEVYCGLEIDYIDSDINPQAGLFKNDALDYKIGSVISSTTRQAASLTSTSTLRNSGRKLTNHSAAMWNT